MAQHFRRRLVTAVEDRYPVVQTPGPKTLILNVAITDVNLAPESGQKDWSPASAESGILAGASIEAEALDSITGERLAVFVDSKRWYQCTENGQDCRTQAPPGWAALLRRKLDASRK